MRHISSPEKYVPPPEMVSRVFKAEKTTGCDYGQCTYCKGYEGIHHRKKPSEEYRRDVKGQLTAMTPLQKAHLTRIYIGSGDPLRIETEELRSDIAYTRKTFAKNAGRNAERVAMYGSTRSIDAKTVDELISLRYAYSVEYDLPRDEYPGGLNLIYWGVETGATDLLNYVKKGCTQEGTIRAAEKLNKAGIDTSVMIMPGLGGMKYYDQHVAQTAKVLGAIKPRFLTFIGINPDPDSEYNAIMEREVNDGTNRPLSDHESVQQIVDIIGAMPTWHVKAGSFTSDVEKVGHNPQPFGPFVIDLPEEKKGVAKAVRERYNPRAIANLDRNSNQKLILPTILVDQFQKLADGLGDGYRAGGDSYKLFLARKLVGPFLRRRVLTIQLMPDEPCAIQIRTTRKLAAQARNLAEGVHKSGKNIGVKVSVRW